MNKLTAFPTTQYSSGVAPTGHSEGMSLRDYFAAACISKLITNDRNRRPILSPDEYAELAYQFADAMLKARGE